LKKISLFLLFTFVITASGLFAQNPDEVAPNNYHKIFENDRVRVFHVVAKAGDKIAKHSHPAHFAYALKDTKLKMTNLDTKKTETAELKQGKVIWLEAVTHEAENIGPDTELLVVDLKK
jgi:quercetin dioxygenase-like cupin family protein